MTRPSKESRDALQRIYNDISAWDKYPDLSDGVAVALEIIRKHMDGSKDDQCPASPTSN